MATTLRGQTPPSSKAREDAKLAAAPEPVYTRTFATVDEFIAGQTKGNIRALYPFYAQQHGADAMARFAQECEAAMIRRDVAKAAREAAKAAEGETVKAA